MNTVLIKVSCLVLSFVMFDGLSIAKSRTEQNILTGRMLKVRSTEGEPVGNCRALWMAGQFGRWIVVGRDGNATVPAGTGTLVVKKGGYQCNGIIVKDSDQNIEVTLFREDQNGPVCKTRPIPFSKNQQAKLLKEVKDRLWHQIENGSTPVPLHNDLLFLAETDLAEFRKYVKKVEESEGKGRHFKMLSSLTRGSLISVLWKKNLNEAMEIIEKEENPMLKVSLLGRLQRSLPSNHEDQKLVYKKIVQESSAIRPALAGLGMLASASSIASSYGHQDLVKKVVEKEIDRIKNLGSTGRGGFIRSYFAGLVMDVDPKLADEFSRSKLGLSERIRARARFAFECCRNHPKKSIEVMKELYEESNGTSAAEKTQFSNFSKVAYRLAGFHPTEVSNLIEIQQDPVNRSWMWLLAAMATQKSHPSHAKIFLQKCLRELEDAKISSDSVTSPSRVYMVSLPVVEEILPGHVHGLVWQTYISIVPKSRWISQNQDRFRNDKAIIAAGIARYREDLAKEIVGNRNLDKYQYGDPAEFRSVLILKPEDTSRFLDSVSKSRMNFRSFISPEDVHFFRRDRQKFWDRVSWLSFHDYRSKLFESF